MLTRSILVALGLALSFVSMGCTSLTEPNAITVTKEAEPPTQAPAAANAAPQAAQPGTITQPAVQPQAAPRPVAPPAPAPAKGGSCGE